MQFFATKESLIILVILARTVGGPTASLSRNSGWVQLAMYPCATGQLHNSSKQIQSSSFAIGGRGVVHWPGSSGRRDPEKAPPMSTGRTEPRRPGHSIPLIDHAIEGEDSYKPILWPLSGVWMEFAAVFLTKLMARGKKSANGKEKIRRANEQKHSRGTGPSRQDQTERGASLKLRQKGVSLLAPVYKLLSFPLDVESQREETFF
ncbi:uncharacterized protein BKA55DRAFT_77909 [Fusarium redolens]|uniref:Uncharacterized protein n=1 Tax=Fusarium redolens TaxID=48865 RepID=A0A9P9GSZ7_FUSRE|nr:uncharacterized protein BKA55DRAFT_77909 [Fusarium redolens]KAH7244202.1 hypothetical protein BKA55DRAFT_77909 [Fusarium redolens]